MGALLPCFFNGVPVAAQERAVFNGGWEPLGYRIAVDGQGAPRELVAHVSVILRRQELQWQGESGPASQGAGVPLCLWSHFSRVERVPSQLNEQNFRWVFPRGVSLGALRFRSMRWNGQPVDLDGVRQGSVGSEFGRRVCFDPPVENGGERSTVQAELRYTVVLQVPQRYGRHGVARGQLTLGAPWYPLVVNGDRWRFRVPHRVRVFAPRGLEWLVGGKRAQGDGHVEVTGPFAPLFAAGRWWPHPLKTDGTPGDGPTGVFWSATPMGDLDGDGLRDPLRRKTVTRVRKEMATARRVLSDGGSPVDLERGAVAPPVFVQVPSRLELAASMPGLVAVSDRAFQIFPVRAALELHGRAIRLAQYTRVMEETFQGEPAGDVGWASELRASLWLDHETDGDAKSAGDLVRFASFHPAVDQLLYAPQVPFADVMQGAPGALDVFGEDPDRAWRRRAHGRAVMVRARDGLPGARWLEVQRQWLAGERAREALHAADPRLASHVQEWLEIPLRPVNYQLRGVGGALQVERQGLPRHEPVEIRVDGAGGGHLWDGEGPGFSLASLQTSALDSKDVMVDPRGAREQDASLTAGHPRGDDAMAHAWRPPLLRGFGLNAFVSEGQVTGFLDFAMRRRFNLERGYAFALFHDVAASGGSVSLLSGWGPKRHNNSRQGFLSTGVRLDRLHSSFADQAQGGWRPSVQGSVGMDTRVFSIDPRMGGYWSARGRLGPVFRDDGSLLLTGSGSVRGNLTRPMGLWHSWVFVGGLGWTLGDALAAEQMRLGDPFLLRSVQTDEFVGRGRAYGSVEHRFTFVRDLAGNVFHLVWLRELQWATFVGGGAVFDAVGVGGTRGVVEAGGGLRFHFEYGGVQPGVLSVDLGIPLTRDPNGLGSDGLRGNERPPVTVYASFDQYF